MYQKIFIPVLLLLATNVMAGAEYDSKENVVTLSTPLLAQNIDMGWIEIYNEKHITIMGFARDEGKDKIIGMCGKEPSLGLIFLNGSLKLGAKVPNVTDVDNWDKNKSKEDVQAGWVRKYVLKGDDALDLMDLLYEYQTVGFAIVGEGCEETKNITPGKIIIKFETRGLERAMKRIK